MWSGWLLDTDIRFFLDMKCLHTLAWNGLNFYKCTIFTMRELDDISLAYEKQAYKNYSR